MRKRVHLILMGLLLSVMTAMAQEAPPELLNAFRHGSAQELAPYLESSLEIVHADVSKEYHKEEAVMFMTNFFAQNKVKSFTVNHQGSRNESGFIVGTLSTGKVTFRINIFFKKKASKCLIHQIRIDKTNE